MAYMPRLLSAGLATLCVRALKLHGVSESRRDGGSFDVDADVATWFDIGDVNTTVDRTDLPFETALWSTRAALNLRSHIARERPILWIHIHKAGGSFMCEMARRAGERIVTPDDRNCNWKDHDTYAASGNPAGGISCAARLKFFREKRATWGQIERELFMSDKCFKSFQYGVMLRDPISLMRSIMNFHPQLGKGFITALQSALRAPARSYGPSQVHNWKIMDNFQTRLLANAFDVPPGRINETHVIMARQLLEHVDIVQRLEDLPKLNSVHGGPTFLSKLGWPPSLIRFIGMKSNHANPKLSFTPDEAAWLRLVNKHDYALYDSYG